MKKTNFNLNNEEIQLLKFISFGLDYKNIAIKMFISIDTVKARWAVIRKKLNATNRANAIYIATKAKII